MEKDWSVLAEHFDELQRKVTGEVVDAGIKRELARLQDLGRAIELGCVNGGYTLSLLDACESLLATDISEGMVRAATDEPEG